VAPAVAVLGAAASAITFLGAAALAVAVLGAAALLLVPSFEHIYPQFFTRLGILEIIV
jgi:hypothetical protein